MIIIFGFILSIILVLFDQLSKILIVNYVGLDKPIVVIRNFLQIDGVYNTGAAFSMLNGKHFFLVFMSVAAFLFITYLMKDFSLKRRPLYSISLVLIYSGTIGNMIDRIFNPHGVFDFIEFLFVDFAIFNIADCYLTIGMIILAIHLLFFEKKDPLSLKFNKKEFLAKFKKESEDEQTN